MEASSNFWAVALGVFGVFVSPLLAFWAARRTSSGKIATSDATDLWNESQKIREFLNQQVTELRAELDQVKEEARSEIARLESLVQEKESEITQLRALLNRKDDNFLGFSEAPGRGTV